MMPTDPAYRAADPDDFPAMIEPGRYARRSSDFEEIIARTEEHFWNPEDRDYVDFSAPWPGDDTIVPFWFVLENNTAVWDRLDEGQRIALTNESARWNVSNILHGEQGALSLSASLCDILLDPGAQEYAANQTREEARHVAAFGRYIGVRWGTPYPVGPVLGDFLRDIVLSPIVYKKLIGMQMLLEGLAMGAFSGGRKRSMRESTNIFRVLVKTLLKAGIITERTVHIYSAWIDTDELGAEGDTMIGDAIAAEGIEYLREINRTRRVIGQKPIAA